MKKLASLPLLMASLPAAAHEAQDLAHVHAHPHGLEAIAVALVALLALGFAFRKFW